MSVTPGIEPGAFQHEVSSYVPKPSGVELGVKDLTLEDRMTQPLPTTGESNEEQERFLLAVMTRINGALTLPKDADKPERSPPSQPLQSTGDQAKKATASGSSIPTSEDNMLPDCVDSNEKPPYLHPRGEG